MSIYGSLAIMILVIYCVRMIPMILLRKEIKNVWLRSFLYYVPYVTLAVMTVPSIFAATENPMAGLFALLVGIVSAFWTEDLFVTAILCCTTVLLFELLPFA